MKKTLGVLTCFTLFSLPTNSFAAIVKYESHGYVGFQAGSGVTPPVNPNNPDPNIPVNPQNPDGSKPQPGTEGPLSIDFFSTFDFGINAISNKDQTYLARAQRYFHSTTSTPNYIQVTDNRGTLTGWTLKLVQNGQFKSKTEGKYPILKGATLSLNQLVATSKNNTQSPLIKSNIELIPDTEAIIAIAVNDSGAGTWVMRWGEQENLFKQSKNVLTPSVKLFVPGKTGKNSGAYTTTFTWTLSSLPLG